MKAKKLYFMECHLAGRQYHDADEVFNRLKVGTKVRLVRDEDNKYDKDAVAVVFDRTYDDGEKEEFLLGYIPRSNNEQIAQLIDMGWGEMFECRISWIRPEAHYEEQIHLTIRIKRNEHKDNSRIA